MESIEIGMWSVSFIVGLGVGALFYIGLWWTIGKRFSSKHVMIWWLLSFIIRIFFVAAIFYLIANVHLMRYAFLLVGFMLSRKIIVKMKTAG